MKKILLLTITLLVATSSAYAIPDLQLFISGATYDYDSQTWVTTSGSFDLYVIGANSTYSDVIVSMALAPTDIPGDVSVGFDNLSYGPWRYGYAPIDNLYGQHNQGDLPQHGVYPTWFTEVHAGAYDMSQLVGNTMPGADFWDPSSNTGPTPASGQARMFHVTTGGSFTYVHFDAYTLNSDGTINTFAPFTHDAGVVPEPGTLALLGTGLVGLGAFRFRRKKS